MARKMSTPASASTSIGATPQAATGSPGPSKNSRWKGKGNRNTDDTVHTESERQGGQGWKGKPRATNPNVRQRPSHFLAFPLSTYPALHTHIARLTSAFLSASPPVEGLDPSIVISGVRMHLTVGVMPLRSEKSRESAETEKEKEEPSLPSLRTPSEALAHLESLRPQILEFLAGEKLQVALGGVDVMKIRKRKKGKGTAAHDGLGAATQLLEDLNLEEEDKHTADTATGNQTLTTRADPLKAVEELDVEEMADVLYVPIPESDPSNARVWALGRMIERSFKEAGFITETRPLKLHLTIVNTSHRRPKPRNRRPVQFSYTAVKRIMASLPDPVAGSALPSILAAADEGAPGAEVVRKQEKPGTDFDLSFGTWTIPSVELWVMGSRDLEGRYVSLGGVRLQAEPAGDHAVPAGAEN